MGRINDSNRPALYFGIIMISIGIIMATVIFPFWNLIREDIFEEAEILSNIDGTCYVTTSDEIPKTIEHCNATPGDIVSVKYGHGLAWAEIITP